MHFLYPINKSNIYLSIYLSTYLSIYLMVFEHWRCPKLACWRENYHKPLGLRIPHSQVANRCYQRGKEIRCDTEVRRLKSSNFNLDTQNLDALMSYNNKPSPKSPEISLHKRSPMPK